MSLKAFHITFITIVTLFSWIAATWSFRLSKDEDASVYITAGVMLAVFGTLALAYGIYFYKTKIKNLNF